MSSHHPNPPGAPRTPHRRTPSNLDASTSPYQPHPRRTTHHRTASSPFPTPPHALPPFTPSYTNQAALMPYNPAGNSTSWQSNRYNTAHQLNRLQNAAAHIGVATSPYFPKTPAEHMAHNTEYLEDCNMAERKKMELHLAETRAVKEVLSKMDRLELGGDDKLREKERFKVGRLYQGKTVSGNRTAVLAETSIWGIPDEGPKEWEDAVHWPCREELKVDGEMQIRQGQPRKLPLPKLNKLKAIDRSEMVNSGEASKEEVEKMEKWLVSMPFRMKEIASVEVFDRTEFGMADRYANAKGLEPMPNAMKGEVRAAVLEWEVREECLLGHLLDELLERPLIARQPLGIETWIDAGKEEIPRLDT